VGGLARSAPGQNAVFWIARICARIATPGLFYTARMTPGILHAFATRPGVEDKEFIHQLDDGIVS
jgi:hypothetical protein